jgi:hypothetical protein
MYVHVCHVCRCMYVMYVVCVLLLQYIHTYIHTYILQCTLIHTYMNVHMNVHMYVPPHFLLLIPALLYAGTNVFDVASFFLLFLLLFADATGVRAALVASCFLGALPPVALRAAFVASCFRGALPP